MKRIALFLCLMVVVSVGLAGCSGGASGPATAPVNGTLSINGQPANNVQITFAPMEASLPAASGIVKDGKFELLTGAQGKKGAVPGKYKVVLATVTATAASTSSGDTPPDNSAMMAAYKSAKGGPPKPTEKLPFPKKYTAAATSDKDVEVKSGSNDINIEISGQ